MTKFGLKIIGLLLIVFTSCKKDNDDIELNTGDISSSEINITTTNVINTDLPARNGFELIKFKNAYWFMGGKTPRITAQAEYYNDIWKSSNGKDWELVSSNAPWNKRANFNLVCFKNKLWIIGGEADLQTGFLNDIWNSTDGITWNKVTDHGPWQTRSQMSISTHNNKLYLIGGHTTTNWNLYQDIWESTDGITWSQVGSISDELLGTQQPGQGINEHSITKLGDTYYLTTGQLASSFLAHTSVLKSVDMVNWELVTRNTPWKTFSEGSLSNLRPFVYNNHIVVVVSNGVSSQHIYSSTDGETWEEEFELEKLTNSSNNPYLFMHTPRVLTIEGKINLFGSYQSSVVFSEDDSQVRIVELINE